MSTVALTVLMLYALIGFLAMASVVLAGRSRHQKAPESIQRWLSRRWERSIDPALLEDYRATFEALRGQRVLQHLIDTVYCQVYTGKDPIESAHLNGRRSLVHEILENIDMAANPGKYQTAVDAEQETLDGG